MVDERKEVEEGEGSMSRKIRTKTEVKQAKMSK